MKKICLFQRTPYFLSNTKRFIFIIILTLLSVNILAQWQPDVRLTYDGAQSYMSGPFQRDIASSGNILHVVWHDQRTNWDIYYKRSSDAGLNWSADTRLSNGPGESHSACVAVSGSMVYVFWCDTRDGHWELFYIRSTDGGLSWGTETRFTANDGFDSPNPVVSVSGSIVHITWQDNRDGNYEAYYKRSTDAGLTWGTDTRLTNNPSLTESISSIVSGSYVHIAWYDNRDGNYEIYYKRSTDGGINWGADIRLSSVPYVSEAVNIAASGSLVHVAWQDVRDGYQEIYYKRSTDAGSSWGIDTRLTNNPAESAAPNLTLSGTNVHLTWQDTRDGNHEIYYKRSTDEGLSWGADTRLTSTGGTSVRSFSTVTGTAVHVVWMDESPGNWEIYYKQDPTGNPVAPPVAPVLVRPPNNSVGMPLTDTLIWNPVTGAISYRLQVALDAGFSSIILNDSTLTSASRIVPGLSPLTTYYWRVNAKNSGGTSPWSMVWNFKTKGTPTTVTLLIPPNNSVNIPATYTFRWSKAYDQLARPQVSNYWFEMVTDTVSMANILRDSTLIDTFRVVTGLNNNTTYYWRVKAKNEIGWGNFAAWFRFTTTLIAPAAPTLVLPANGSYNLASTVRFIWNRTQYALTYRLQVALDSLFTNMVVNDSTLTDTTILAINLTVNRYYWWRVNAKNAVGTSPYSAVWRFGTFFVGLNQIGTEVPKEYNLYNNYPNPFNPSSNIRFDIPNAETTRRVVFTQLIVYDLLGREITTLVNEQLEPGTYEVEFDGTNYPSGVYFYKLETEYYTHTKRMVLVK